MTAPGHTAKLRWRSSEPSYTLRLHLPSKTIEAVADEVQPGALISDRLPNLLSQTDPVIATTMTALENAFHRGAPDLLEHGSRWFAGDGEKSLTVGLALLGALFGPDIADVVGERLEHLQIARSQNLGVQNFQFHTVRFAAFSRRGVATSSLRASVTTSLTKALSSSLFEWFSSIYFSGG